jgi:hypothetical protein
MKFTNMNLNTWLAVKRKRNQSPGPFQTGWARRKHRAER